MFDMKFQAPKNKFQINFNDQNSKYYTGIEIAKKIGLLKSFDNWDFGFGYWDLRFLAVR